MLSQRLTPRTLLGLFVEPLVEKTRPSNQEDVQKCTHLQNCVNHKLQQLLKVLNFYRSPRLCGSGTLGGEGLLDRLEADRLPIIALYGT